MCTILRKSVSHNQNDEKLQEKDWTKSQVKFCENNTNSKKKILEKKALGNSDTRKTSQTVTPGHLCSNRSNFQMRRAQKKPAIEEREMLELEEKLKKTEENVFRLQSLTYNESLSQFIPKGVKLCASDSSFNMDKILERKKDKEFSDVPDFTTRKCSQFLSKDRYKSSIKKKKVLEDIEYDSLSMLMVCHLNSRTVSIPRAQNGNNSDERRARRAAALRLSESEGRLQVNEAERSASECSVVPAPAPAPAPAAATTLRSPLRSPSPSPPTSSLSLTAHRSDDTLAVVVGALSVSLPDLSEATPDDDARTGTELSEIETRPSSRLSGVLRFVRAATHAADYSALLPEEQAHKGGAPDVKKRPHFGLAYTNVLRGVMLQDKGAVRNLKTCVREIHRLQKKMKKIRSQDAFSTFQNQNSQQILNSINNTKNLNPEGDTKLQRAFITNNQDPTFKSMNCGRGRITSNNVDVKEWRNNVNNNTPKVKTTRNTLHKAKSDLLEIYGKAGVNITALRRLGERTRWKL